MRVEFLSELSQLPPLAARWEALNGCGSDHESKLFQSYAWNLHVAQTRTKCSTARFRILIPTVWQGEELIGLWPLSLQKTSGAWIARSLDDPFGQFAGVAFSKSEDIAAGVAAIVDGLRSQVDGIQIAAVLAGTPLHVALQRSGAKSVASQQAVYIDLRPHGSFKDFARTVNSKTRKNLRNLSNRLHRAHAPTHRVIADADGLAGLLLETFNERLKWLQRNGRTSAAFQSEHFRPLVAGLGQCGGLELIGFSLGAENEKWISAQWGIVYAGRYYAYMSAMDPDYEEFSPGRIHLGKVIESCAGRGIEVLELMPPASRYKLEWSDSTRSLETMSASFTLKGRIALGAESWAIAKARQLSRMLPESLRRSLVRRLNRQ